MQIARSCGQIALERQLVGYMFDDHHQRRALPAQRGDEPSYPQVAGEQWAGRPAGERRFHDPALVWTG